jgi:hypothetical protein
VLFGVLNIISLIGPPVRAALFQSKSCPPGANRGGFAF